MSGNTITDIEDRIQRFVEGGLARLLAGRLHPREVAIQLAKTMDDHAVRQPNGGGVAPDTYLVRLNPTDQRALLEASPELNAALCIELIELARRSNLIMEQSPTVKLLADQTVEPNHVLIAAQHTGQNRESTATLSRDVVWEVKNPDTPIATLLLQPNQPIALTRPVVNLGRHRENHIVVDNPNVSRHHAQIRLKMGRYVLFDLGSTVGTTVNGQNVREAVLRSGDVIGMAGTSLIYIEDTPLPSPEEIGLDDSDTTPLD
jgi:FHA domain-containing protein